MISTDYTWSEDDSYIDKYGNVFVGFVSNRDAITLKLHIKQVKSSFQLENDSLRVHYLCPQIDGQFGELIEHLLDSTIKGKPLPIDKWQLLRISDVRAINGWLKSEAITKELGN